MDRFFSAGLDLGGGTTIPYFVMACFGLLALVAFLMLRETNPDTGRSEHEPSDERIYGENDD